jgi:hypothetical protein
MISIEEIQALQQLWIHRIEAGVDSWECLVMICCTGLAFAMGLRISEYTASPLDPRKELCISHLGCYDCYDKKIEIADLPVKEQMMVSIDVNIICTKTNDTMVGQTSSVYAFKRADIIKFCPARNIVKLLVLKAKSGCLGKFLFTTKCEVDQPINAAFVNDRLHEGLATLGLEVKSAHSIKVTTATTMFNLGIERHIMETHLRFAPNSTMVRRYAAVTNNLFEGHAENMFTAKFGRVYRNQR